MTESCRYAFSRLGRCFWFLVTDVFCMVILMAFVRRWTKDILLTHLHRPNDGNINNWMTYSRFCWWAGHRWHVEKRRGRRRTTDLIQPGCKPRCLEPLIHRSWTCHRRSRYLLRTSTHWMRTYYSSTTGDWAPRWHPLDHLPYITFDELSRNYQYSTFRRESTYWPCKKTMEYVSQTLFSFLPARRSA